MFPPLLPFIWQQSPASPHSLLNAARMLEKFLDSDHLSVERVHIYGMSLGAAIAAAFYKLFVNRARSLALQGAPMQFSVRRPRYTLWKTTLAMGLLRLVSIQHAIRRLERHYGENDCALIKEVNSLQFQQVLARDVKNMSLRAVREYGMDLAQTDLARDYYSSIRAPTLLIDGREIVFRGLDTLDYLKTLIPHASVHVVKNAGHLATFVAPEEVTRVLLEFISKAEI